MDEKKIILLTGASGHLGRRLALRLLSLGFSVRGQYRNRKKADKFKPPEVEAFYGDIRDTTWMTEAVGGCDYLVHAAAFVSLRPASRDEMQSINVEGTRNIIGASLKAGVRRFIHISSVAAVGGAVDGRPLNEQAEFNLAGYGLPYFETKREAERIVLAASGPKMSALVVNPSIIIYPPEREITKEDLKRIPRIIPFYFDFGLNLVHVDDVINGIISALEHGRGGERYILGGDNLGSEKIFAMAKQYLGIRHPLMRVPLPLLYPVGLAGEWFHRLRHLMAIQGKGPRVNRGIARLAKLRFYYDISKAKKELGYNPRSMESFLREILSNIR